MLRADLGQPGFAVLRFEAGVGSRVVRRTMVEVRRALHTVIHTRYLWLNRFDHQVSSQPHQDAAPGPSVLVLGYESSPRASRLCVVDLARLCRDRGETGTTTLAYLQTLGPEQASAVMQPYETDLGWMDGESGPRIVVLNNSDDWGSGQLGVMHGAELHGGAQAGARVVNSMMLVLGPGMPFLDEVEEEAHFLDRDSLDG